MHLGEIDRPKPALWPVDFEPDPPVEEPRPAVPLRLVAFVAILVLVVIGAAGAVEWAIAILVVFCMVSWAGLKIAEWLLR